MAKLSRIYIHGFGSPKARFRELMLDFRDNTGLPTDAVLFLRNGGGKTSLISLFYSVFLPDRGEFLGRRNKKNRHFDEYVSTGRLGVILVELQFPAHGGHRRTFGLLAFRRETDPEAQRTFFTFRHAEEVDWPQLPVKGLIGKAPPADPEALLKYLRTCQRARDIDFYETESQTKWHKKLEEVNFDPAVLRHHLKMNAEEGGVVELFKHTDPREFARLFLELTLEPDALFTDDEKSAGKDLLRVQLGLFREKVKREPETRAVATFCEAVKGPLEIIRDLVQRRIRMEHELNQTEADATRIARSILDHHDSLTSAHEAARQSCGDLKTGQQNAKDAAEDAKKWRRAAEYLALRLEADEANRNAAKHREQEVAAEKKNRLLQAAHLQRQMETNAAERKELQKEIDRTEAARGPALDELRQTGSQLYRALQIAVKDLAARQHEAKTEFKGVRDAISQTRTELEAAGQEKAAKTVLIIQLQKQIGAAAAAREALRRDGLLKSNEDATTALARWQGEVTRLGAAAAEAERQHGEAGRKVERIQLETVQTTAALAERSKGVELATNELALFEHDWNTLAATVPLRAVTGDATPNPWNPAITSALAEGRESRRLEFVRNVLAGQSDKRIVDNYQDGGVFPPPNDIIQVRAQLAKLGIQNAQPLYEYLDQTLPTEAEARLRWHPAAHSGILLQNDEDFRRASRDLHQAPCERPVLLVSRSFFSLHPGPADSAMKVVLPQDRGYWDRKQASHDILGVRGRHEQLQREQGRINSEMSEWAAASAELQRLTQKFSEGKVESLRNSITALRREVEEHKEALLRQKSELAGAKEEQRKAGTEAKRFNQDQQQASLRLQRLGQHLEVYERHVAGWQREVREAEEAQAELGARQDKLNTKLGPLLERESTLGTQITENDFLGRGLDSEIAAILPAYYDKKQTVELESSLDALRKIFATRVQSFEQRFNQSEASGQIKVLHQLWQKLEGEFKKAATGLDRADIEYAAIDDQLPTMLAAAHNDYIQAISDRKAAELVATEQQKRLLATKRVTDTEPGVMEPTTSVGAHELANRYRNMVEQAEQRMGELSAQLSAAEVRVAELAGQLPLYANLLPRLGRSRLSVEREGERHAHFTGEPEADTRLVEACATDLGRLKRDLGVIAEKIAETFSSRVHRYAVEYSPGQHRPVLLDQYVSFTQEDVEQKIDSRIEEVVQALAGARGELASIDKERDIVLTQLDQRARIAERRLTELDKASRMPETIPEWAGRSFLHVRVPASHDAAERKQRLTLLLNSWIREAGETIPDGVGLAYETLMAVLGDRAITMKMLKPEYQLLPDTYDIAGLHKFSGGEKVTAAILLYAVLVRYRAMRRGVTLLGSDSGFLLLDNPFGQVTLMQFIDLQVRIARLMGLQLIYATGVADFTALAAFPHRIMLRNSGYDPKTGDRFISHDPNPPTEETHRIEWTVLGEKQGTSEGKEADDGKA